MRKAFSASSRRPSRKWARPSSRQARLYSGIEGDRLLRLAERAVVAALAVVDHRQHDVRRRVRLIQREREARLFAGPIGERHVLGLYSNFRQYASASIVRAAGSLGPSETMDDSRPIA